jgi:hypothetical protein
MKKSIILALVMSGVLIFSSCEKNKEPVKNPATNQTVSTTQLNYEQVVAKIKDFITKTESADKTTEAMNAIDAAWNIDAALNYGKCKGWLAYSDEKEGTISYDYDGTFSNASEIYYDIYDYLDAELETIKSENKELRAISVIYKDSKITVYYILTFGEEIFDKNAKYINSTDWWEYGFSQGKCNGYTGSGDAATRVRGECNLQHFVLLLNEGEFFTDPKYIYQHTFPINPDDDTAGDNDCDRLAYTNESTWSNFHTCISPTENDFYVDGLYQNANILQSNGGGLYDDVYNANRIPTSIHSAVGYNAGTYYSWTICTESKIKNFPK